MSAGFLSGGGRYMVKNIVVSRLRKRVAVVLSTVLLASSFAVLNTDVAISANAKKSEEKVEDTVDDNVRKLFIGDSRSVDMFSAKKGEINGKVYNNITVYAKDGATYGYLKSTLKKVKLKNYDVVVSWMGANDHGNFEKYQSYYKKLNKKKNLNLILCSLGYSDNRKLGDIGDCLYYNDGIMQRFNQGLNKWAKKNRVETINLYSYTKKHVAAREHNGVHYVPAPTVDLWNYTVRQIGKKIGKLGLGTDEEDTGTIEPDIIEKKK